MFRWSGGAAIMEMVRASSEILALVRYLGIFFLIV
jgi:hypothetical protein